MTAHAENTLRGTRIAKIIDLPFTAATSKAAGAKCLIAGENGQILNLVSARAATVCTIVANERAVAEQEQVRVRVEEGATRVASKAVDMPPVAGCDGSDIEWHNGCAAYLAQMLCLLQGSAVVSLVRIVTNIYLLLPRRSPYKGRQHPLRPSLLHRIVLATPSSPTQCISGNDTGAMRCCNRVCAQSDQHKDSVCADAALVQGLRRA